MPLLFLASVLLLSEQQHSNAHLPALAGAPAVAGTPDVISVLAVVGIECRSWCPPL